MVNNNDNSINNDDINNDLNKNNDINNDKDPKNQGKKDKFMDVDRMVNDGLGGGNVTRADGGFINDSTIDTMKDEDS